MADIDELIKEFDKVDVTIFSGIDQQVDSTIDLVLSLSWQSVTSAILPVVATLFSLYVVLYGLLILRGVIKVDFMDASFRVIKIFVILSFITSWPFFTMYLKDVAIDVPAELSSLLLVRFGGSAITGDGQQVVYHAFDELFHKAHMMGKIVFSMGSDSWGYRAAVYIAIMLITVIFLSLCSGILMVSKVVVAVFIMIAPICLVLFMFDSTKGMGEGWLRMLLTYAIKPIIMFALVVLAWGIAVFPIEEFQKLLVAKSGQSDLAIGSGSVEIFIVTIGAVLYAFKRVEGMAATIAGGVALGTYSTIDNARAFAKAGYNINQFRLNRAAKAAALAKKKAGK